MQVLMRFSLDILIKMLRVLVMAGLLYLANP